MAKISVLLIEDNAEVLHTIELMLQSLEYKVAGAVSSGEAALDIVREAMPDVILMDIGLKGKMDGIEAAEQIYDIVDIPIVYITGASDRETIERAKLTAPYGYLIKPINFNELRVTIDMAMHKHRLEQELRKQKQWLDTTLRNIGDGVITTNGDGEISFMNYSATQITGWTASEAINQHITDVLHVREEGTDEYITDFNNIQFQNHRNAYTFSNLVLETKNNNQLPVEMTTSLIRSEDGDDAGGVFVIRDITERKEAEKRLLAYQQKLRSLASVLSIIEDRERRKIANELHESIGQTLAVSKMQVANLTHADLPEDSKNSLHQIHDMIEQSIKAIRSLTLEISPPALYELGFEAGVKWLLERTEEKYNIETEFHEAGAAQTIDRDIRTLLFQAVRELMNNVVKHANAKQVKVSVSRQDDRVSVTVEDDGEGFDPEELSTREDMNGGFGLFSVRERLEHLQGSVEVHSHPGKGTEVILTAPLNPVEKNILEMYSA
ncbi:MAG: response regulator [Candidatus Marinimicrobia bacterium]|nr:response regulator [Candidatus Neomarinimicrobiota bacterium]